MREIEQYYASKEEPLQSVLLAVREVVLGFDDEIKEAWKWGTPVFMYRQRMFCYVWLDKKNGQPYLGVMGGDLLEHPMLRQTRGAKVKKLFLDVNEDLPIEVMGEVFALAKEILERKLGGKKI